MKRDPRLHPLPGARSAHHPALLTMLLSDMHRAAQLASTALALHAQSWRDLGERRVTYVPYVELGTSISPEYRLTLAQAEERLSRAMLGPPS